MLMGVNCLFYLRLLPGRASLTGELHTTACENKILNYNAQMTI